MSKVYTGFGKDIDDIINNQNKPITKRKPWNIYFMDIAKHVAERSTCVSRQVGAIIIRDKQIISTGYNGAPSGFVHCTKETCLRKNIPSGTQLDVCWASHAEMNAICQAAKHGVSVNGASLYCTTKPCLSCCKNIINSGIKTVYYLNNYNSPLTDQLVSAGCIEMIDLSEEVK